MAHRMTSNSNEIEYRGFTLIPFRNNECQHFMSEEGLEQGVQIYSHKPLSGVWFENTEPDLESAKAWVDKQLDGKDEGKD